MKDYRQRIFIMRKSYLIASIFIQSGKKIKIKIKVYKYIKEILKGESKNMEGKQNLNSKEKKI